MQSFDTVLKHGKIVWDPDLLPVSVYEERMARVRKEMGERNIDALLIYGDVRNHGSLTWLSNYLPRVRDGLLIIEREDTGKGVLFANVSSRDILFARSISYTDDVRSFDKLIPEASEYLQALRQKNTRFGFVGVTDMPLELWERLFPNPSLEPGYTDVSPWFDALRFHKSYNEKILMRKSAEIASGAIQFLVEADFGLTEKSEVEESEIAAKIEYFCRRQGAEDVRVLISSRNGVNPCFTRGSRSVRKDETVAVYLALQFHRYWAEIGRTLKFTGRKMEVVESDAERAVHKIIEEFQGLKNVNQLAAANEGWKQGNPLQGGASIYPICEGIGIDPSESIPSYADQMRLEGSTLVIRWGHGAAQGMQFYAETVELNSDGIAVLTQNR